MRVWLVALLVPLGCGSTDDAAIGDATASDAGVDAFSFTPACHATSECPPDMFCEVGCSGKTGSMKCEPRPTCDDAGAGSVCACDGLVYESLCLANAAGTTAAATASDCPAPQGTFACGRIYCDAGTFCQIVNGNTSQPNTCITLPVACADSTDCACFGDAGGCGTCVYVQDAGFRWSCVVD